MVKLSWIQATVTTGLVLLLVVSIFVWIVVVSKLGLSPLHEILASFIPIIIILFGWAGLLIEEPEVVEDKV